MKTWLVTGGAGFIGGNFVLEALARGDTRVVNLDALTYAGNRDTLASVVSDRNHVFVHAAEYRQAVDQAAVGAEHVQADGVAELVVLDEIKQQQRLHSVKGKALPHLGEEAHVDAFRMAEELLRPG